MWSPAERKSIISCINRKLQGPRALPSPASLQPTAPHSRLQYEHQKVLHEEEENELRKHSEAKDPMLKGFRLWMHHIRIPS